MDCVYILKTSERQNMLTDHVIFTGASKKKAKHNAAQSVLQQMMGLSNGQTAVPDENYGYTDTIICVASLMLCSV